MIWNRKPRCPITVEDKQWIEESLRWINKHIIDIKAQATILPTKKFFEINFRGEEKDAEYVLKKVGEYFQLNTDEINLGFYHEEDSKWDQKLDTLTLGTGGLYIEKDQKYEIWIEAKQLKNPISLIAVMAHELCHYVLIGQKGFLLEGEENEWITDLLAIAYGFGIFLGNSSLNLKQVATGIGAAAGWEGTLSGYLPQQVIAYAMAEIEIRRTQEIPSWQKYLKNNFRSDFKRSMKYLKKTRAM